MSITLLKSCIAKHTVFQGCLCHNSSISNSFCQELLFQLFFKYHVYLFNRAFFERTILCNSLVWSCSLTAKSNLTYQEAIESEKRALQSVSDIPFEVLLESIR